MTTFQDIVRRHARPRVLFDQEPVKEKLLADLRRHRQLNNVLYGAYFGIVCLTCIVAIATMLSDMWGMPTVRGPILGGAGVTVTGMLFLMRRAVREWTRSDMLITLAGYGDETQLQRLIEALLASGGRDKAMAVARSSP